MSLKTAVSNVVTTVKANWSKPPKGKYISYKEFSAYSVGAMGVQFAVYTIAYISLSASSFLFGAAYGIKPLDLQILMIVSTLLNFVLNPIKSMLFDSLRLKSGKFRPYMLTMGFPTMLFAMIFVFIPVDMDYMAKLIVLFVLFVAMQFFLNIFVTASLSLVNVMSPDSKERTGVISISSIIYSMAPTLINLIVPLIANSFPGKMADIGLYRLIFPVFMSISIVLGWFGFFGTKERIVASKQYKPKVKFLDGFQKIARNKYFWITTVVGALNTFKLASGVLFPWLMQYGKVSLFGMDSMSVFSVFSFILGSAAFPALLFAPVFINKFGKRTISIASNAIGVFGLVGLIFTFQVLEANVLLFFLFTFIFNFSTALTIVTTPAMAADYCDYQQYKTGDRLDGFANQTSAMLTGVLGFAGGLLIALVQESNGLKTDYNILFVDDVRNPIFITLLVIALAGTVASAIPFFFYDLSESKHKNIVRILTIRAMFEDYANGQITDKQLVQAIDKVKEAEEAVLPELHKFESEEMLKRVADAETVVAAGLPEGAVRPDEARLRELSEGTITKETRKEIKLLEKEVAVFGRAFKGYIAAEKLLAEKERYALYDEIKAKYDGALARVQEEERLEKEKAEREKAEKIAALEEYKAEKKAMKEARKTKQ